MTYSYRELVEKLRKHDPAFEVYVNRAKGSERMIRLRAVFPDDLPYRSPPRSPPGGFEPFIRLRPPVVRLRSFCHDGVLPCVNQTRLPP